MSDDPMLSSVRAVNQIRGAVKPKVTDLAVELEGRELEIRGWKIEQEAKTSTVRLFCHPAPVEGEPLVSEERVHYWSATDATWRRVQEAAAADDVPVYDWVRDAVLERLKRDAPPKTTVPLILPGQESLL